MTTALRPKQRPIWVVTDAWPDRPERTVAYEVTPEGIDAFLAGYVNAGGVEKPGTDRATLRQIEGPEGQITTAELWVMVSADTLPRTNRDLVSTDTPTTNSDNPDVAHVAAALGDAMLAKGLSKPYYDTAIAALRRLASSLEASR